MYYSLEFLKSNQVFSFQRVLLPVINIRSDFEISLMMMTLGVYIYFCCVCIKPLSQLCIWKLKM